MTDRLPESMQRYLDGVADDLRGLLGDEIELLELRLERRGHRGVQMCAAYRLGDVSRESVGRGASTIQAHARLRDAVVTDRIGLALQALTQAR